MTKPFQIDELLARLRALTRRITPAAAGDAVDGSFGDVTVDLVHEPLPAAGAPVRLTPTEWRMSSSSWSRNPGRS